MQRLGKAFPHAARAASYEKELKVDLLGSGYKNVATAAAMVDAFSILASTPKISVTETKRATCAKGAFGPWASPRTSNFQRYTFITTTKRIGLNKAHWSGLAWNTSSGDSAPQDNDKDQSAPLTAFGRDMVSRSLSFMDETNKMATILMLSIDQAPQVGE